MATRKHKLAEAELLIAYVLRYGVLACLSVIGIGLVLFFSGRGTDNAAMIDTLLKGHTLHGANPPSDAAHLWQGVTALHGDTVIAFGLILLISLPILRVALTTLIFLRDKDWAFFALTLTVLTVLLSGIFLGRAI